ncbi:MAG: hypothetical protein QXR05_10885 [Candidatus Methanomethylicia archaeon]
MSSEVKFSREVVRFWFHRLRKVLPKPKRRCRGVVAVDEQA